MDEAEIYRRLHIAVNDIFLKNKFKKYYGPGYGAKILNHVNNCIVVEGLKNQRDIFVLRCSAILCSVYTIPFKKNIRKILESLFPPKNQNIIYDIKKVLKLTLFDRDIDIQNYETWKLFPRYAVIIEHMGEIGSERLCYNQTPEIAEKNINKIIELSIGELEKTNIPYIINLTRIYREESINYLSNIDKK